MGLFRDYWKYRERGFPSRRHWMRAWAKRLLCLRSLSLAELRIRRFQMRGAVFCPFTFISEVVLHGDIANLCVGHSSFIGRATIQLHAPLKIGNYVCINDGVTIFTASHDIRSHDWQMIAMPVKIEDYAWIASNAIILPGVTIGRGAVVGAGAVVSRNVPADSVVTGNPATVRENIRPENLKYSPESFLAIRRAWVGTSVDLEIFARE